MGLRDAPLLSPTEVASLPFPVALRTQWGHLVSRPLLVWASVRGFTMVTEGPSDEPTVHTRAIQHFLASCGQDLEWDSWPVRRHIESLCRHRRMALETQLPLTSKLGQFGIKKTRVEWALTCSRGGCAVDASLVLSLVSHFSQRGGVRLQYCLQTPPHAPSSMGTGWSPARCLRQLLGSSFPCAPRLDSKLFVPQSGSCPVH